MKSLSFLAGHYWRRNMGFSIRPRDEEVKSPGSPRPKKVRMSKIQDQSDAHHFF